MDSVSRGNLLNIFKNLYEDRERGERSQDLTKEYIEEKDRQLEVAAVRKSLRQTSIQHWYEAEMQATFQEFEEKKEKLRDEIEQKLRKKIKNLELSRDKFVRKPNIPTKRSRSCKRKKLTKSENSKVRPSLVSGPYIIYMLRDEEIIDDLRIIKSSLMNVKEDLSPLTTE